MVVAYDGAELAGYQLQPDQRTVQGELERALEVMTGRLTRVRAAGRTDAGVHALGQVVAFDSPRDIAPRGFVLGLNRMLPPDVRVQRAAPCPVGYNPRYEALAKTYRYVLKLGEVENPLLRHRAYQLVKSPTLDLESMRAAAALFTGTHDFRAFRGADDRRENSTRTLYSIDLRVGYADDPTLIAIDVRGTAFMRNMVRILAGTLVDIGRGRTPVTRVPAMLGASSTREQAGHTAPAQALTLVEVELGRHQPSPLAPHSPERAL
jgi:tRNA pseudouridine38-40 synthase